MHKKMDISLFIAVIVLATFGLLMVYSASSIWAEYKFQDSFYYMKRQFIFLVIGIFLMIATSKIDYNNY